ncbi:hypothetical protein SD457_19925 [Coprobacillaceae bacterium CR2/5/TPMF4]|nr:hypothetical protein SD457_19925 [Coprobacillaceae bacterium CR2/5/TPMF4]
MKLVIDCLWMWVQDYLYSKKQEMVKDTKLEELIEEGIDDLKELLENSYLIS